ncbi:MAG: glycosyltransferase [Deltaproteobacteria bacterium]|nr:glycosyltransferase [Deltaproteobacteria bacterium]
MDFPLKAYRKRWRIRRNEKRLRQELDRYESAFKARDLTIPNAADIRKIMKDRFPHLRAKPKGELSLIAVYHHYNWEDHSLKPALEEFGQVRHYDWFARFNHERRDWRRSVKREMNRDLLTRIGGWIEEERPDVLFTYLSGELIDPETAQGLRAFGIPMIHFSLNDKENFVGKIRGGLAFGSRDICRAFDLAWTSTADALRKYCVEGVVPLYLPEGANPEIHRPSTIDKTIAVSFVGQCYGNRPAIIRRLGEAGIPVEAFGYGWPNGALSTEEMVRLYSQSRINLGFGGVAGYDATYCLKGRDFEIPMSGGLYLTEYHPELETVYDLGREIVTYRGFDDLAAKIRHLLDHPDEAEAIRQAGLQRARREHTWEMRFAKVFTLMNLLDDQSRRSDERDG